MTQSVPPEGASDAPPVGGDERRNHSRAPIELKVEYQRLNSFFADYTRNISKGGTFIVTAKPLPVGTEFVFKLGVPTLEEPLALRGKVAWVVSAENATALQPAGMGIRFQYQDDVERERVDQVVEKLIVDNLGPFLGQRLIDLGKDQDKNKGPGGRP